MDAVRGLLDHGEFGEGLGDSGAGVGQLLAVTGIGGRAGAGDGVAHADSHSAGMRSRVFGFMSLGFLHAGAH